MAGPDVDGGLGIARPGDLRDVQRFSHEAMATIFEVYAMHPDRGYAGQAAQAVFDLVDRLEGELSRFLPNSDISRVNRLGAGEGTRVGATTLECLVIAQHVFQLTGGTFDASIGTGLLSLDLDSEDSVVRATKAGVQVDLGAIGKGYAVDLAAELLEEWGLGRALIHGGFSSILALDPPAGRDGWPLTLSDPLAPSRILERLSVRQAALGASGLQKGAHIIDPRSGEPVRGRLAAWALVPRPDTSGAPDAQEGPRLAAAAVADAVTTAFMLLRENEIDALCASSPGLEAWILSGASEAGGAAAGLVHFGTRLEPPVKP